MNPIQVRNFIFLAEFFVSAKLDDAVIELELCKSDEENEVEQIEFVSELEAVKAFEKLMSDLSK